nr:MAG TPA: hypothetical protein [Caudoviricetes sp.]
MLKNLKSVTLFVIFFKKNHPGFHRGNCQRKHNYNNKQAGFISRKEYVFFLFLLVPAYI